MSLVLLQRLSGAVSAAVLLAACNAGGGYAPPPSASTGVGFTSSATSGDLPDCGLPKAELPGTYVFMQSEGNTSSHGEYKIVDGTWTVGTVSRTAGARPMHPSRDEVPATGVYVYVGTYGLARTGRTGCAYLVASIDGHPLDGNSDAMMTGGPNVDANATAFKATGGGPLSGSVMLDASGGHGLLKLMTGISHTYDTAHVTFHSRIDRGAPTPVSDPMAAFAPHAAFPCTPSKSFVYQTIQSATPGSTRKFGFPPRADNFTYVPVFEFCGVENSILGDPDPVARVQHFEFSHGRMDFWTDATFNPAFAWSSHPDVMVWEQAYTPGFVRDPRFDVSVALVHVR
jgi:hypothetical protein